jgi:hypothetical protein
MKAKIHKLYTLCTTRRQIVTETSGAQWKITAVHTEYEAVGLARLNSYIYNKNAVKVQTSQLNIV